MTTKPKHVELFITDAGQVVAQARNEEFGRLGDPFSIAVAGQEWSAFLADWGTAQQSQIESLTAERDAATAAQATLRAEIDRLTALIPQPVDPNAVPATITRTQARLVLHRAGLLDTVLQIIEAGGVEAQIWYEANEWNRASPVLAGMAQALGFSDEQVDNLFRAAGAIVI
jgi:hypothetical protein